MPYYLCRNSYGMECEVYASNVKAAVGEAFNHFNKEKAEGKSRYGAGLISQVWEITPEPLTGLGTLVGKE